MQLFLVRHGETEANCAGVIQGQSPGILSAVGKEQAKKLALRLQKEDFDALYSSDLRRAIDTAKEIALLFPHSPFFQTQELREIHRGEWEGRSKIEIQQLIETQKIPPQPLQGESLSDLLDRAEKFLSFLLFKHVHDCVLLVGHNRINKAIISAITGQNQEDIEPLHNTSLCIFQIQENRDFTTLALNDVKHLQKN